MSKKVPRLMVIQFTPQLDVEMPIIRIEEAIRNTAPYDVVYELILQSDDGIDEISASLTEEELILVRNHINLLLYKREKDPNRQCNVR